MTTTVIRYQLNDLTSFIDASHIYGTTYSISGALRTNISGELQYQVGESLLCGLYHSMLRLVAGYTIDI